MANSFDYQSQVIAKLEKAFQKNETVMKSVVESICELGKHKKFLYAFGSGHSSLLPLELYHRAGGYSLFIPIVADYLMPQAGPPTVKLLERSAATANAILAQFSPEAGEMIWIMSQSGINSSVVDFANHAKSKGLATVAFTSVQHSMAVAARHPSGKRLCEVADHVVDLCGEVGDASVEILSNGLRAGPTSLVTAVSLGHAMLVEVCKRLESDGIRCTYTSVNTPTGEALNRSLELEASRKDYRLKV